MDVALNPFATPYVPAQAPPPPLATQPPLTVPGPHGLVTTQLMPNHILYPMFETDKVLMARPTSGGQTPYALKRYAPGAYGREKMRIEGSILKKLRSEDTTTHPSILGYIAFINDPFNPPGLLVDLCDMTLHTYQNIFPDRQLPDHIVKDLMTQLLSAAAYMHERHIVHRDLHPGHILLVGPEPLRAKIIDFGLAIELPHTAPPYHEGMVCYRPPDVHLGSIDYGTEYDMWSLGCVMAEMVMGTTLFLAVEGTDLVETIITTLRLTGLRQINLRQLPWNIVDPSFSWLEASGWPGLLGARFTPQTAKFINGFLQFDPEARTTAAHALRSSYLCITPPEIKYASLAHDETDAQSSASDPLPSTPMTDSLASLPPTMPVSAMYYYHKGPEAYDMYGQVPY